MALQSSVIEQEASGTQGGQLKKGQGGDFCKISANYVQFFAKGVQIYAKSTHIYPKFMQIYPKCMQKKIQIVPKTHHSPALMVLPEPHEWM